MTALASFVATATFPIRVPSPRMVEAPVFPAVDASRTLAGGCDPHRTARPFKFALVAYVVGLTPDMGWFGLNLSGVLRLGERRPNAARPFPISSRSLRHLQNTPAERANRLQSASSSGL